MSAQLENGYIRIANEIWDEVIRRDFTKRQKDILLLIWRLSYGCQKKTAHIPKLKDFEICGILPTHISQELKYLVQCKVIEWDRNEMIFSFNKEYQFWQVSPVKGWDYERFKELIHLNLPDKTYQNGNLPKQEVTETVRNDLPKREVFEPAEPCDSKEEDVSKDNIKNNNIYTSEFETFWSLYPRKVSKKVAFKRWQSLMKDKVNPTLIYNCTRNYAKYCADTKKSEEFILHPSTFLNQDRYLDYEVAKPNIVHLAPKTPTITVTDEERERLAYYAQKQRERNGVKIANDD